MSNLTLFQSSNTLPAHLQREQLDPITKALMGNDNKRISIEGGAFRMIVGGQEVAVNEERGMNVVIIRAAEHNSRMYYAGTYVKGAKAKPTCWSADGVKPHEDVKDPQSSACATCPQNIKGSGQGDSRACRFQRRIAVLLENDINGDIYAMSVPAASLFGQGEGRKMPLQQYARFIGGHGIGINAVVTEMRFDTNATAPKLTFSAVRPLEAEEWETVRTRGEEQAAIDACTMTVGQLDETPDNPVPVSEPAPEAVRKPATSGFKVTAAAAPPPAAKATPKAKAPPAPPQEEDGEAAAEPQVRAAAAKPSVPNVSAILDAWGDDVDD